jgi:hypothetical protein
MKKSLLATDGWHLLGFILILCTIFLIGCDNSNISAKTDSTKTKTGRKKPNMWVDKGVSNKLEGNFNLQHFQLSEVLKDNETDSIFYPIDSFKVMLDTFRNRAGYKYLHVYIVSYDSGRDVSRDCWGKLALIFHPAISTADDGPPYYSFDSTGKFYKVPTGRYSKWDNLYSTVKMPTLIKNLDFNDISANYSTLHKFSDTRRISYLREDIDSLIMSELKYQYDTNKVTVTGLRAMFASYSPSGNPHFPKHFVNRIFVIYELTTMDSNQKDSVFYIDDQLGFLNRRDPDEPVSLEDKNISSGRGVDNGHLCPPNCP